MWARVARFEGDPESIDARIERLRTAIESGDVPVGLAEAKLLMLVNRESGDMLGVTLFDSEEALRKGDEAMNAAPATPAAARRSTSTRCHSTLSRDIREHSRRGRSCNPAAAWVTAAAG